jgi:hypothetical protein
MANQELYGKTYSVSPDVLKVIQTALISNPNGEGVKRAKYILKNGAVTYQELKRLKNFFDYFNPETGDKIQYALAGGDIMKQFIETTLNQDRAGVNRSKDIRQDMNVDVNLGTKAFQTPRLNEDKKKELKKNAIAVIVNKDNKFLLLKRAKGKGIWQPEKWALVGGGIEKGETPQKAVER